MPCLVGSTCSTHGLELQGRRKKDLRILHCCIVYKNITLFYRLLLVERSVVNAEPVWNVVGRQPMLQIGSLFSLLFFFLARIRACWAAALLLEALVEEVEAHDEAGAAAVAAGAHVAQVAVA